MLHLLRRQPRDLLNAGTRRSNQRVGHDRDFRSGRRGQLCVRQRTVDAGYSDSYDHFHNFFNAVRSRQPVVEDATFGFRAAGAALLSNISVDRGSVVHWDPETMKLA